MSEINHENVLTQLRDALNRNNIKLWIEPYCVDGESNESEIVVSKQNKLKKLISIYPFHRILQIFLVNN